MRLPISNTLSEFHHVKSRRGPRDRPIAVALAWIMAVVAATSPALAQQGRHDVWCTNGAVKAIATSGGVVYLGGAFTQVGPATGATAALDATTGLVAQPYSKVAGEVYAVAPDGSGGWYIGGNFVYVKGQPRNHLAHVDAAGNLTSWNPNPNHHVRALVVSGGTVYVGGSFNNIGGQPRNRIAAIEGGSGLATSWNANANGPVYSLALSGNTIWAAGQFTSIGSAPRNNVAALDDVSGSATAWNPDANARVDAIVVSGTTVYVGGRFTSIGGQPRNRIAALDAITALPTLWNPNANGDVAAVAVSGGVVYVAGNFSQIAAQTRSYIAALDAGTGQVTSWNPSANFSVSTLAATAGVVYVGGSFNVIGGETRPGIAALDASSGIATSWNPNANGAVLALAVSGGTVYAGGQFYSINVQPRTNLAALNATTGAATSFVANTDNTVNALAVSGDALYAGGSFISVNGQSRPRLVRLNRTTGAATGMLSPNNTVNALAAGGGTLFVGGNFSSIGTSFPAPRNRLAAFEVLTGNLTSWDPDANGSVSAVAVDGDVVYVGGDFTTVYGLPRSRIAAVEAVTGTPTGWNPGSNSTVWSLAPSGSVVYASGVFTTVGGQPRNYVAALDAVTGSATAWDPNSNNLVRALALSEGTVYAAGDFEVIGGEFRSRIAALNATTGAATSWNPGPNDRVLSLSVSGGTVYAGGDFTGIAQLPSLGFAGVFESAAPWWQGDGSPVVTAPGVQQNATAANHILSGAIFAWEDHGGAAPSTGAGVESDPYQRTQGPGAARIKTVALDAGGMVSTGWPTDGLAVTTLQSTQLDPQAVPDDSTGAFVVWTDDRGSTLDLYAQRLTGQGTVAPGWPADGAPLCAETGVQRHPRAIRDGRGGLFVAWEDDRAGNSDIYLQRMTRSGTIESGWPAGGVAIATEIGDQLAPALVSDDAGGVFVSWMDRRAGDFDIYVQRVSADGSTAAGWSTNGQVLCDVSGDQSRPSIVGDGTGGAIVVWADARSDSSDIYAQRVLSTGVVAAGWTIGGVALCTAAGQQLNPVVISDQMGGAMVAWVDGRPVGAGYDIYVHRVTGSGSAPAGWTIDGVAACLAGGDQTNVHIVSDEVGGGYVAWEDGRGVSLAIYAIQMTASGVSDSRWPVNGTALCDASGNRTGSLIIADGAGGAIVGWTDERALDADIYAFRISGPALPTPTSVIDTAPRVGVDLLPARPNPSRGIVHFAFELARPASARLEIFDIGGRHIRTVLAAARLAPGRHVSRWDGQGEAGQKMDAGVYFARLQVGREKRTSRFVIVR